MIVNYASNIAYAASFYKEGHSIKINIMFLTVITDVASNLLHIHGETTEGCGRASGTSSYEFSNEGRQQ